MKKGQKMKNIPRKELFKMLQESQDCLAHLRTSTSHRRFFYDIKALLFSKAFRRLYYKNQVATCPSMTHLRNRGVHTAEVVAAAITIGNCLGLNIDLITAIAWGHDIGHFCLGHQAEEWIQKQLGKIITHEIMGPVIAQKIERRGKGLNLTYATMDGMFRHSGKNVSEEMSQEALVVRYADKFAYIFADYNDFKRMERVCPSELDALMDWFGSSQRDRTLRATVALCDESMCAGKVQFATSEPAIKFDELRSLMYDEYDKVVEQDVGVYLGRVWNFLDKSRLVPPALGLGLLTDREIFSLSDTSTGFLSDKRIMSTGLGEIIKLMPDRDYLYTIDLYNPDLVWQ